MSLESLLGVVTNMWGCDIVTSRFNLMLRYYIRFRNLIGM